LHFEREHWNLFGNLFSPEYNFGYSIKKNHFLRRKIVFSFIRIILVLRFKIYRYTRFKHPFQWLAQNSGLRTYDRRFCFCFVVTVQLLATVAIYSYQRISLYYNVARSSGTQIVQCKSCTLFRLSSLFSQLHLFILFGAHIKKCRKSTIIF